MTPTNRKYPPGSRRPRTSPPATRVPAPGNDATPTLNLRLVVRALTRYWWQILAVWIIGSTALVAVVYSHLKPVYEATATLRSEPKTQELFGFRVASESNGVFLETQVQLITSANVLSSVVANPEVAKTAFIGKAQDAVGELRKSLQVYAVPNTYLIRVSMRSPTPDEAKLIVNEVVKSYIRSQAEWSYTVTHAQIANLETYERQWNEKIEAKEKELEVLVASNVVDPQVGAREKAEALEPGRQEGGDVEGRAARTLPIRPSSIDHGDHVADRGRGPAQDAARRQDGGPRPAQSSSADRSRTACVRSMETFRCRR